MCNIKEGLKRMPRYCKKRGKRTKKIGASSNEYLYLGQKNNKKIVN